MASMALIYAGRGSRSSFTVLSDLRVAFIDDFSKYAGRMDPDLLRHTLISVARQSGTKFVFSMVDGGYRTEQVKKPSSVNTLSSVLPSRPALEKLDEPTIAVPRLAFKLEANK